MDDPEFLSNLEQLKSTNQEIFSENCDKIIKILLAVQHIKIKQPFTSIFGTNLTESLDYTIKKLIQGILCTNPDIQMNYNICFNQILRRFGPQMEIASLLDFILMKSNKNQAINKTEKKFFLIGKLYLFKSIIITQTTQISDLNLIYQNIFEDLASNPWISDLVLDVVECSLSDPTNIKLKIKTLINIGKMLQTEHNFTNIQYLLILDKACTLNNISFPLESQIKDRIANFKNLQKSINVEITNFPNVNRGIHYTMDYVKRQNIQFAKDFFVYLLGNNCENYKGFFITLNFLKSYLKGIQITDLQYIQIEELWHLWMKNLNVKNQQLKNISKEIMEKLNKLVSNSEESKISFEFLQLIRAKPSSLRFTVKSSLAQNLIKNIQPDQLVDYFKFLKKHLHNSSQPSERSFYLNEIYVFGEISFPNLQQSTFDDICFLIFEEGSKNKLKFVYQKFSEQEKMEQSQESYIESNREIILSYFYSLLQSMIQSTPLAYQEKKNILYKGLDDNNNSKLLKLIILFQEKKQDFSKDKQLSQSISQLEDYVSFCQKIERQVKKILDESQTLEIHQDGIQVKQKLAFNNLMTGICIQALIFPEEMFQALQEMKILYKQMQIYYEGEKTTKKRKLSSEKSVDVQQNKKFISVLVDIMISLLTKSASFLKTIINTCFQQFVQDIDSLSLNTLVMSLIRSNADYMEDQEEIEEDQENDINI